MKLLARGMARVWNDGVRRVFLPQSKDDEKVDGYKRILLSKLKFHRKSLAQLNPPHPSTLSSWMD